jgi:hypothetical protein
MVSDEQLLDGPQYFSRAVTGHAEAVIRPEAGVTVRTHTGMNRALERDGVLNGIWVCSNISCTISPARSYGTPTCTQLRSHVERTLVHPLEGRVHRPHAVGGLHRLGGVDTCGRWLVRGSSASYDAEVLASCAVSSLNALGRSRTAMND